MHNGLSFLHHVSLASGKGASWSFVWIPPRRGAPRHAGSAGDAWVLHTSLLNLGMSSVKLIFQHTLDAVCQVLL